MKKSRHNLFYTTDWMTEAAAGGTRLKNTASYNTNQKSNEETPDRLKHGKNKSEIRNESVSLKLQQTPEQKTG